MHSTRLRSQTPESAEKIELEQECEPEPEPEKTDEEAEEATPAGYEILTLVTCETLTPELVEAVEVDPVMEDIWGRLGSKKSKKKKGKRKEAEALDSPLTEASS